MTEHTIVCEILACNGYVWRRGETTGHLSAKERRWVDEGAIAIHTSGPGGTLPHTMHPVYPTVRNEATRRTAQCIYCNRFTSQKSGGTATRLPGEMGGSFGESWEWVCKACKEKGMH